MNVLVIFINNPIHTRLPICRAEIAFAGPLRFLFILLLAASENKVKSEAEA